MLSSPTDSSGSCATRGGRRLWCKVGRWPFYGLMGCSLLAPPDSDFLPRGGGGSSGVAGEGGASGAAGSAGSGGEPGSAGQAQAGASGTGGDAATCSDGELGPGETGPDCGGRCLRGCEVGQGCVERSDCRLGLSCVGLVCREPRCDDNQQNGTETDIDCGGPLGVCGRCAVGQGCITGRDCTELVCDGFGRCAAATCFDNVANGQEPDRDCGATCDERPCDLGSRCFSDADCRSVTCAPYAPLPSDSCAEEPANCLCQFCANELTACSTNCRTVFSCFLNENCGSFEECSRPEFCQADIIKFGNLDNPDVQRAAQLFSCAVRRGEHCRMECQNAL